MKKIFSFLITGMITLSLSACGTGYSKTTFKTTEQNDPATTKIPSEPRSSSNESTNTQSANETSLIVYFSWSGNTELVAQEIQTQTGADIFEIVPAVPYSDDYNTVVDLAQKEQKENARPEIENTIKNLDQYDTVYVGYPNWWGDMPMILYTFFDTYDLSNKTILPFCTSGGSGLSNTVSEISSLEPNATVVSGLHIGDSHLDTIADNVKTWLAEKEE